MYDVIIKYLVLYTAPKSLISWITSTHTLTILYGPWPCLLIVDVYRLKFKRACVWTIVRGAIYFWRACSWYSLMMLLNLSLFFFRGGSFALLHIRSAKSPTVNLCAEFLIWFYSISLVDRAFYLIPTPFLFFWVHVLCVQSNLIRLLPTLFFFMSSSHFKRNPYIKKNSAKIQVKMFRFLFPLDLANEKREREKVFIFFFGLRGTVR